MGRPGLAAVLLWFRVWTRIITPFTPSRGAGTSGDPGPAFLYYNSLDSGWGKKVEGGGANVRRGQRTEPSEKCLNMDGVVCAWNAFILSHLT